MSESNTFEHPERIGPYHIVRMIGQGGMGIVYEAQQEEPVRRRVALKVMKVGADPEQVLRRFEAERQALAVMSHPAIAKVFDAGVSSDGRSYFVMEFVDGGPIHEFFDGQLLTIRQRIELFIDVCEAVQHAHQKGVIHRDLKPANVLVTDVDGKPRPRVIDFGIAKATGFGEFQSAHLTQSDQMVGTPAYMSPEQIAGSSDVETRSDVYSLGVLLYHLLLGELPFEPKANPGWAAFAAQLNEEPPTFGERLFELAATQETLARLRSTTPQAMRRVLSGDLQWIVLKAMDKDRDRRYSAADALAVDLRRYLEDQPIDARPPTVTYRLGKLVRRNRVGAVAVAVATVALALGAVSTTVGMVQARASERIAQREAETAAQVSNFLVGLFEASDPDEALGDTITARDILDSGAERIRTELADQPLLQARLMHVMGTVYRSLGRFDSAAELLTEASEIRGREAPGNELETLASVEMLGRTFFDQGRFEEAERLYLEVLAGRTEALGPRDPEVGAVLYRLGEVYLNLARYEEADSTFVAAESIRLSAYGPDDVRVAAVRESRGTLARDRGDNVSAVELYRDALRIREGEYGLDHPNLHRTLHDLGVILRIEGDYEESEALLTRALDIRERVYGPAHPRVATTLNALGNLFSRSGRFSEAEQTFVRSLAIKEEVYRGDHPDLANSMGNLAILYARQEDYAQAEPMLRRSLQMKERLLGTDHPSVASTRFNLGSIYSNTQRYSEAELQYNSALKAFEASFGPDHPSIAQLLDNYSSLLREVGRGAEGDAMRQRADDMRRRLGSAL